MHNLRQYTVPLQRYVALMDLQVISLLCNEHLCGFVSLKLLQLGADECESFRKETRDCFTSF